MIRKWKTIASKKVFDHERLTLLEDEVALPNGKKLTYLREKPVEKHSVAVIAVNESGDILVQKEYNYPPDEIMLQLPGGSINAGEEIIDAAKRELAEESNLTAQTCRIIGWYYTNNRRSNQKQYVVLCTQLSSHDLPADPEEFIDSIWITPAELARLTASRELHNINLLAALQLYANLAD